MAYQDVFEDQYHEKMKLRFFSAAPSPKLRLIFDINSLMRLGNSSRTEIEICTSIENNPLVTAFEKEADGRFNLQTVFGEGKFRKLEDIFTDGMDKTLAEPHQCHASSVCFAGGSNIDCDVVTGMINPAEIEGGVLHSVVEADGRVFDFPKNILMHKSLYDALHKTNELTRLNKSTIIDDWKIIGKQPINIKLYLLARDEIMENSRIG